MKDLFLDCIQLLGKIKEHREIFHTVIKIKKYLNGKSFEDLREPEIKLYTLMKTFINNTAENEINWDFYCNSSYRDWDFEPIYKDDNFGLYPKYKEEYLIEKMMLELILNITKFEIGKDIKSSNGIKLNLYGFQHCRTDFKNTITFHAMCFKYNKNGKLGKLRESVPLKLKLIKDNVKLSHLRR